MVIIFYDVSINLAVRAPSIAGIASFAVMQPSWFALYNLNVVYWTNFSADAAAITF